VRQKAEFLAHFNSLLGAAVLRATTINLVRVPAADGAVPMSPIGAAAGSARRYAAAPD
jgi:hypothetical protein